MDEWGPEPADSPATIGVVIELLAQMAADELVADVTSETLIGREADCTWSLRLLIDVRRWVERINIAEAVADERKRFSNRDAAVRDAARQAAEVLIGDPGGAFKRAVAIVAEAEARREKS